MTIVYTPVQSKIGDYLIPRIEIEAESVTALMALCQYQAKRSPINEFVDAIRELGNRAFDNPSMSGDDVPHLYHKLIQSVENNFEFVQLVHALMDYILNDPRLNTAEYRYIMVTRPAVKETGP